MELYDYIKKTYYQKYQELYDLYIEKMKIDHIIYQYENFCFKAKNEIERKKREDAFDMARRDLDKRLNEIQPKIKQKYFGINNDEMFYIFLGVCKNSGGLLVDFKKDECFFCVKKVIVFLMKKLP